MKIFTRPTSASDFFPFSTLLRLKFHAICNRRYFRVRRACFSHFPDNWHLKNETSSNGARERQKHPGTSGFSLFLVMLEESVSKFDAFQMHGPSNEIIF
jgi:hypothetical protein